MASILTRTIYFDNRNDRIRFFDWNIVGTTLGTMVEPRAIMGIERNTKAGFDNYNHNDECCKVTNMQCMDRRNKFAFLGAGQVLHGGEQFPQNYDYNS